MSDRTHHVHNLGVAGEPLSQGYELFLNRHVAANGEPDDPYDPFGDGTHIYGCPECGATWNADDLHLETCSRRRLLVAKYALSLWQPWADLCVTPDPTKPWLPVKPVENRGWPVPSTLPQWGRCSDDRCSGRHEPGTWEPMRHPGHRHAMPVVKSDGPFPFRLAIHAAKKVDHGGQLDYEDGHRYFDLYVNGDDHVATVMRPVDDPDGWHMYLAPDFVEPRRLRLGALVGYATVTGCHHASECPVEETPCPDRGDGVHCDHWYDVEGPCCACGTSGLCSRWAQPDQYHWTLADPEPLAEPIPMRGRQKLWRLPEAVTANG